MTEQGFSETAVIGAGGWGTALANLLADKGFGVRLWVYEEELAETMRTRRENPVYLPGVRMADGVSPSSNIHEVARGAGLIVWAVPAQFTRRVLSIAEPSVAEGSLMVSATKGVENESLLTMLEIFSAVLNPSRRVRLACISGPSFAREVSMLKPTAVAAASDSPDVAGRVQEVFSMPHFRVYTSGDVRGVELGGALKNVIALAAGMADGLELGSSTRAALITRGLAEITRLGVRMGAKQQTFSGLSGIGDLVLTCSSELSRNRTVGYEVGRGRPINDVLEGMRMVAEGVTTVISMVKLGQRYGVELPIAERVYSILYEGQSPREAVAELMGRGLKEEFRDVEHAGAPVRRVGEPGGLREGTS